jgi:hypothetical protein
MFRRFFAAMTIAGVCALGVPAFAQTDEAKKDTKKAGEATKEAGKDVGKAAKATGKAVKHKVTGKKVTANCNDGTTYTGKTRKGACEGHGGVKSWGKA